MPNWRPQSFPWIGPGRKLSFSPKVPVVGGVEGRLGVAGKNSGGSMSVESGWGRGFGGKTPLPARDGEGCRPHAAGRSSFRFHLACTDSACVGVGGGGGGGV